MTTSDPSPGLPAQARPTQARPIVRLTGLRKRFGTVPAIDDVSLDIREGEFLCLLGPSGSGKSTLLRLMAGLDEADGGTIEIDGRDVTGWPPHRRPLNMMFQSYALFPHMSVAGNVGYGLRMAGLPKREIAARTDEMLGMVQLSGLERRYPAQLSGGQRQRVALARALARRPRVLLLDEPLAALDRALRARTQAELKSLQARLGTTFVVVTHDQEEAMTTADRVGIMDGGRLIQLGTPREVHDRPGSRFVAGFLGEVNELEGHVTARDGELTRVRLRSGPEIVCTGGDGLAIGAAACVCLRPARMMIAVDPGAIVPNAMSGDVDAVTFLGDSELVQVRLGDGQRLRTKRLLAGQAGMGLAPGQAVTVGFTPDAAIVLPA